MFPKGLMPLVGLIASTLFSFMMSKRIGRLVNGPYSYVCYFPRDIYVKTLSAIFVLFLLVAYLNVPALLQTTSPSIVEAKNYNREMCVLSRDQGDEIAAENHIRNSTLSKMEAAEFHKTARMTIDRMLQRLVNQVFINGLGVMYAGVPMFFLMTVGYLSLLGGFNTESFLPRTSLERALAAIRGSSILVSFTGVLVFFVYHFWIESRQVYTCQEISGHWFTYTLTTMTLAMVFVHIRGNDLPGLSVWYAAWIVLYQVLTLRVLKFTQHFFHDSEEAVQGIKAALVASPFIFGVIWGWVWLAEIALVLVRQQEILENAKKNDEHQADGDGMTSPPKSPMATET